MREVARSTTTPGRPSEYWTYMLSSQSRAGNWGHAGKVAKRLKRRSTRGCAAVCGKLPTSEGAAKKRGCCILPLLGSGENHTASTPCTISEIRTSCSEAQYNSKTQFRGQRSRTGDRRGCQRISGKRRRKFAGSLVSPRGFAGLLESICR